MTKWQAHDLNPTRFMLMLEHKRLQLCTLCRQGRDEERRKATIYLSRWEGGVQPALVLSVLMVTRTHSMS